MPRARAFRTIGFVPRKYGQELLVDVGRVREWPTFVLTDEPHSLAFYEILLIARGRGRVWIDHHAVRVAPGVLLFTAPGQIRRWQARAVDGPAVFFPGAFIAEFFQDALFLQRLQCFRHPRAKPAIRLAAAEAERLAARLEEMRAETRSLRRDSSDVLRAMLYELVVRLNRRYADANGLQDDTALAPFVLEFKALLDSHLTHWHRVSQYARRLGITAGHLNALARRHFGQPAGAVIRDRLVSAAKRRLLYTDDPAAAVAAALGFEDPSYFTRFFRRETGVTPAAYRISIRKKHQNGDG